MSLMSHLKDLVEGSNSARISIKRLKSGDLAIEHTEKIRLKEVAVVAEDLKKEDRIILKVEMGNIVSIEKILKKSVTELKPKVSQ